MEVAIERAVISVEPEALALIVGGAGGQHAERNLLRAIGDEDGACDFGERAIAAHRRNHRDVVRSEALGNLGDGSPLRLGRHELVRDVAAAQESARVLDALGVLAALRGGVADQEDVP